VVASNDQRQYRRDLGPGVIPVVEMCCCEAQPSDDLLRAYLLIKSTELTELFRDGHALQVLVVAYRLKVPTYQEQIDFIAVSRLEISDVLVNSVQLAVTTSLDRNLPIVRCGRSLAGLELAFILEIAEIEVEVKKHHAINHTME